MIVFTCGGTGGHVYPAIALAQALAGKEEILFIGSDHRTDKEIIVRYGFQLASVPASGKNPWTIVKGFFRAYQILKKANPKVLVATGGYLTFPVALAGKFLNIPLLILEQNVIPGQVNKVLQWMAKTVCVAFKESLPFFKVNRVMVTGNPIRQSYIKDPRIEAIIPYLNQGKWLVVIGGSQGAEALNQFFMKHYGFFGGAGISIVHLTGDKFYEKGLSSLPQCYPDLEWEVHQDLRLTTGRMSNGARVICLPYAEGMDVLYQKASLVVSRAGATTIAELLHFQKPAVLIPFPFAKDNHQEKNADVLVEMGRAQKILEHQLTQEKILSAWQEAQGNFPPHIDPQNSPTCLIIDLILPYLR